MGEVARELGALDILVNNAGITRWGTLAQTRLEDFDRLAAVNARAPFLMMRAAADTLADGGRVVNISSGVTATALAGISLYSGVKAFLDQVTKVAVIEFAARGIHRLGSRRVLPALTSPSRRNRPPAGHLQHSQENASDISNCNARMVIRALSGRVPMTERLD